MALHLGLKNSTRTSKSQVFSSTLPEESKEEANWRAQKGDPLGFFNIHSVAKYHKSLWTPFGNILKKNRKSHSPEKIESWDIFSFSSGFVCYA